MTEGRNFTASETHVFTPTLTNELRFGYNWIHATFQQQNSGQNLSPTFGLGGIPFGPLNGGLPYFVVSGISNFGSPQFYVSSEYENVAQILDNVTKVVGNHTLKAGVNFQRIRVQTEQPTQARGTFNFTGERAVIGQQHEFAVPRRGRRATSRSPVSPLHNRRCAGLPR